MQPFFIMNGKIFLTYDQFELRPALGNELSSQVKGPLYTCMYADSIFILQSSKYVSTIIYNFSLRITLNTKRNCS
jgi:hypothetical protein